MARKTSNFKSRLNCIVITRTTVLENINSLWLQDPSYRLFSERERTILQEIKQAQGHILPLLQLYYLNIRKFHLSHKLYLTKRQE